MQVSVQELTPFQPLLDELEAARSHTDQFGQYRGPKHTVEGRQNSLNYEVAKVEEKAVLTKVVDTINEADEDTLTLPQKAIAVKVIAHLWRKPMEESLDLVQDGFKTYSKVEVAAEQNRGTVAVIGDMSVALYNSSGKDDLKVNRSHEYGHHTIDYELYDGYAVSVQKIGDKSFPDNLPAPTAYKEYGLRAGYGNDAAKQLSVFDPESPEYKLPFIRLGTEEKPGDDLNPYLPDDPHRFAARLVAVTMGKHNWLRIQAPGDELKSVVTERFARTYKQVLVGDTPSDKRPRLSNIRGMTFGPKDRTKSLADYDQEARGRILYAADLSPSDIELSTREAIAKLAESGTAHNIGRALRAQLIMDEFFEQIS